MRGLLARRPSATEKVFHDAIVVPQKFLNASTLLLKSDSDLNKRVWATAALTSWLIGPCHARASHSRERSRPCPLFRLGGRQQHRELRESRRRRIIRRLLQTAAFPVRLKKGSSSSAGVDAMTKRYRSFLLASLVPAFLLGSVFAVVQAQNAGSPAAKPTRWSDPATWPDRQGARRRRQGHHCQRTRTSSSTSVRRRWAV